MHALKDKGLQCMHAPKNKRQPCMPCKRRSGRCRAIGVSNYQQRHLEELLAAAEIKPMVNQARLHPCCCCVLA